MAIFGQYPKERLFYIRKAYVTYLRIALASPGHGCKEPDIFYCIVSTVT